MHNKLEIFINETQFVDWENQIVEVNISYNIYGKPYKMTLLAEDDETTGANIELFENSMKQYIETGIKAKLGDSEYTPPTGGGNVGKVTWEQVIDNPSLYNTYLEQSKGE